MTAVRPFDLTVPRSTETSLVITVSTGVGTGPTDIAMPSSPGGR